MPTNEIFSTLCIPLKAVAVTSGTPVSVWATGTTKNTLSANARFVVLGYSLSLSVAGAILLEDGTGNEFARTGLLAAGIAIASPANMAYVSSTVGNALFLDATASGSISGFILGCEN